MSAFASLPSVQRIEERNLFYLAPLLLIGLLVWVDQGAPRPPLAAGAAAVLAAALPAVIPYERLIGVPSQSDTLLMLALWRVHERWVELDEVVAVVVVCSVLAALAFLVVPRRLAILLPLGVLAFFLAVARPISARMEYAAAGALAEGMHKQDRRWIDHAVAGRGEVGVLWTGNGSRFSVWQNEFFNRSVGPVFYAGTPMEGGLPATQGDARPPHRRPARRSRRAVRPHRRVGRARRRRRREGRRAQRRPVRGRASRCGRPRSSKGCILPTRGRARA